ASLNWSFSVIGLFLGFVGIKPVGDVTTASTITSFWIEH
ncbi:Uncharacterized protein APZ42_010308, partial [Daphnia magna]